MAKKKRPVSARGERRALEREVEKDAARRDKLATLLPGGAPERPIEVSTASLVEPTARGQRCVRCEGEVRVESHDARSIDGVPLRVVTVACAACGHQRALYFRIVSAALH